MRVATVPAPMMLRALVLFSVAGCAMEEAAPPVTEPFIVLDRDLAGFRGWMVFDLDVSPLVPHDTLAAPRRIYSNVVPPPPTEPFPVGAILVKTVEEATYAEWSVHAMVKRGGGFNAQGAVGWEFFDVHMTDDAVPVISWRGIGDTTDPCGYHDMMSCNACHGVIPSSDHIFVREVLSP
jgi:hypothetical protein